MPMIGARLRRSFKSRRPASQKQLREKKRMPPKKGSRRRPWQERLPRAEA